MIGEAIDRVVAVFSPRRGLNRTVARHQFRELQRRGLDAGKLNSSNRGWQAKSQSANAMPIGEVQRARYRSWDLYWNNQHAKKLIRSLEARVVGTGLLPEPLILTRDGTPHEEAIVRAKRVFKRFATASDYLGKPGRGGQDFVSQQRLALRCAALSGDSLCQNMVLSEEEAESRGLEVPYVCHVIHGERLADSFFGSGQSLKKGNYIHRGIEFNGSTSQREAYWIYAVHPGDSFEIYGRYSLNRSEPARVTADQVLHIYGIEDADQFRGIPWFSALLMQARDLGDYQQDELRAAALQACLVMGYRQGTNPNPLGAQRPSWLDSTDGDGNTQVAIPSGAILPLGDGELQMFNPMRPNASAENFSQFLLRGMATGFPGTKASTLTGDYRNSSFSSERSAENDAWPEVEILQDWLAASFCQPIYEQVMSVSAFEFVDLMDSIDPLTFRLASWSGPVARSINPKDDEEASKLAIQNGTSSPQKEAAMRGYNWQENVGELAAYCREVLEKLKSAGVDDKIAQAYVASYLGIKQVPQDKPEAGAESGSPARSWVGPNGEDVSRGAA